MSALLDLSFADPARLKKEGRSFDCSTCPAAVQKIRKCMESREDFTHKDSNQFPMPVFKGGRGYGFCPAKATWDQHIVGFYRILVLCAELQQFPDGRPLIEQDPELLEVLSWFIPRYNQNKFAQNASMIFGSSDDNKGPNNGNHSRTTGKGRVRG